MQMSDSCKICTEAATGGVLQKKVFLEKHLCWSLFFIKVAGFRSATLLKKRFQHRFFTEYLRRLLLSVRNPLNDALH